jgi:hypothetical protein
VNKRVLLKEIPSGKFHSGIFTTFSINLYYLEQQVLPMLASKGIHYVSVLVDSHMLESQLGAYSSFSEHRKRSYSINGIQCEGAFHPKLILLAGQSSLLLLIGSGNLTTSGHGKNLEVWNAIFVNQDSDPRLGFVLQAWEYLKALHSDLGSLAQQRLKTIEDNCSLLQGVAVTDSTMSYPMSEDLHIGFVATGNSSSLFEKVVHRVGRHRIDRITIMSPYYDIKGEFLLQLNERFKPSEFHIILQKEFGNSPILMVPTTNMKFHIWDEVNDVPTKQTYFHAKNFVLEGPEMKYLISGSANASVRAFGTIDNAGANQEVCIIYESKTVEFVKNLGISLQLGTQRPTKVNGNQDYDQLPTGKKRFVFIKDAGKDHEHFSLQVSSQRKVAGSILQLFDASGNQIGQKSLDLEMGASTLQTEIPQYYSVVYCELFHGEISISNKQFVTDLKAFEANNPYPKNKSLNQIRNLILSGEFSSAKIIGYLNTLYQQKKPQAFKDIPSAEEEDEESAATIAEVEDDLLYLSYEEIQFRIKDLDQTKRARGYIENSNLRLWESIFSYLKEHKEREDQAKVDEEENEDIERSTGRAETQQNKEKKGISEAVYQALKTKVERFLLNYSRILEAKSNNDDGEKPNLIDLAMYLVVLEILLHLLSHRERLTESEDSRSLLPINFQMNGPSWSSFVVHIVGLFTLLHSRKGGFKEIQEEEYHTKLLQYRQLAYQTSVCAVAALALVNKANSVVEHDLWNQLNVRNSWKLLGDNPAACVDLGSFLQLVPTKTRMQIGDAVLIDELNSWIYLPQEGLDIERFYYHPNDGYTFIAQTIVNQKNSEIYFLKLYSPGYGWHEQTRNYWNGKVFSEKESKWLGLKSE